MAEQGEGGLPLGQQDLLGPLGVEADPPGGTELPVEPLPPTRPPQSSEAALPPAPRAGLRGLGPASQTQAVDAWEEHPCIPAKPTPASTHKRSASTAGQTRCSARGRCPGPAWWLHGYQARHLEGERSPLSTRSVLRERERELSGSRCQAGAAPGYGGGPVSLYPPLLCSRL